MILICKLLRRHVSVLQLAGFLLANLLGMLIVLLSIQFYQDVRPLFGQEDGIIKPDYMIVNKQVGALDALGLGNSTFTDAEIQDLRQQPFCKRADGFVSSQYKVSCSLGLEGGMSMGTALFFESVPSEYVDVSREEWRFDAGNPVIPIILPRNYLSIYNFGFASSQSLPKITESMAGMIDLNVRMSAGARSQTMRARVVGFSSRINTILVPESFMKWSNALLAPDVHPQPSRLIVEVGNPADDAIVTYLENHHYELEQDTLDSGRITYFLKVLTALVVGVGLLISALSFYILMLSIYLLVQKNTEKLRNLLLLGYTPWQVGAPYQCLAVGANALVLALAVGLVWLVRHHYMEMLWNMFPQMEEVSIWPTFFVGLALFLLVALVDVVAVHRKVMAIWYRKE